ncbi:hypothetical protein N8I77_007881 [Diaporthe amygdali]|uniref:Uncharacterized protein n=1 Tax=Phomopsis amygdali TaxID=1214568 RepID=A0AAD9SDQ4_PHOAM|nr:hypothetical protein N8I77_007881 [Diaporthe amygdali]
MYRLAEAIKFQNEVSRATDRRSSRAPSRGGSRSPNMTDPSYNNMTSSGLGVTGTPRGNSRQATPQKLATPEQLFGRPSPVPTSVFQNTPTPVTQQPASKLADHFDPMQVDSRSGVPQETRSVNSTAPAGGRSLGSSRWATSGSVKPVSDVKAVDGSEFMDIDQNSLTSKLIQAYPSPESLLKASKSSEASPVPDSSANTSISGTASTQEAIIKNADNSGSSMNKGLYGSRWAASASKNESHSSLAPQYPDPSTLEPVYRSSDWLSDLSAEYKALSIKKKGAAEAQSAQASSTIQSNDVQSAARSVGPPSSGVTVQSGKITVKLPPHSAEVEPTVQTSCNPAAFDAPSQGPAFGQHPTPPLTRTSRGAADLRMPSVQRPNTDVSPAVEPSRAPAFAQPVDKKPLTPPANTSSASPFNDVAFKDWYNTKFMNRKA